MMKRINTAIAGFLLGVLLTLGATATIAATAETQGEIFPLPPEVAKNLELFGEGVIGKPVPAPPLEDIETMLNIGPGVWQYDIIAGGKDGAKVRTETYTEAEDYQGNKAWKRDLGEEYVEYIHLNADGSLVKHSEDDNDVSYTTDFEPGVPIPVNLKPGETQTHEINLHAYKTAKGSDGGYRGKATMNITYVGAYEVTTPAGTWPAVLVETAFTIHLGPAHVDDTTYIFVAPGVGRIAEIEVTNVSALLIYHSHTKIAKVLSALPSR
jgi:hypothetical protein